MIIIDMNILCFLPRNFKELQGSFQEKSKTIFENKYGTMKEKGIIRICHRSEETKETPKLKAIM